MSKTQRRSDRVASNRQAFDRNKKKIYATQEICGICGKCVDFSLKFPDPMSPTVDHIIPVSKGGHPSDIDNLQLAHFICNRRCSVHEQIYCDRYKDWRKMMLHYGQ